MGGLKGRRSLRWVGLALFLGAMEAIVASEGGQWQERDSLLLARQEHGGARIGDTVYIAGGLLASPTRATNSAEAYHIAGDSWSLIAPMPRALDHLGVVALNGEVYVVGGYSGDFVPRAQTFIYDPAADEWRIGEPLPQARGACWAVSLGGKIYLFGGIGPGGVSRSTFIYDPAVEEWDQGRNMPTAREHLTATAHGEFIYVIGGRAPGRGSMAVNERYHPATDDWQTLAPMPTARSAMGVATFGEVIIVAGGENPRLFAENEVYDISGNSWSCREEMPIPRHGLPAITLDDRVLFPGGGVIQGLRPTDATDSFMPVAVPAADFLRGDANQSGSVDIADAILVFFFLARGDQVGDISCLDALDSDDDGILAFADGIFTLAYLFLTGPMYAEPFQGCGPDPTDDTLDCQSFPGCQG